MSEIKTETSESPKAEPDKAPLVQPGNKKPPVKLITSVVLFVSFLIMIWYIMSDRKVPYTDQARISGLLVPVVPNVSGYLTKVNVGLHSEIKVGDTLFQIDQRPFLLEIEIAEANLDNTAQSVAGKTATVKSAAGRLGVARAQLERAQRDWNRVQIVLKGNPGALSQADKDQSETALLQATEQVSSAEADLERAEQNLGISGDQNASFRASVKALEAAQLNLAYTSVISSSAGYLESFNIDLGYFASAGQPLATLVSGSHNWIQADMKENNISLMKPGNKVEILLDILPGKIFTGKVESIGYGVSTGNASKGDLPNISGAKGWLRDPQRFPVIISIDENKMIPALRQGGQADVVVFTSDKSGILEMLGKLRIRIISWFSYVR